MVELSSLHQTLINYAWPLNKWKKWGTFRVFHQIAEQYEMGIDRVEVVEDHVHMLIYAPPRYAPYQIVQIMKSISAKEVFGRFSWLKEQLWAGELWSDGYFIRTVGDEVTTEIIRKYITYHKHQRDSMQLELPL